MKLNEVKIGETFKIAGVEFVKVTEGEEITAITKDALFNSSFGDNSNFAESKIRTRLEAELLPKLEAEIGAENIIEFETDTLALDGTRPFPNFRSKVSLTTLDFYRQHRSVFEAHKLGIWWWLATPDSEKYKNIILCVSPRGIIDSNDYGNSSGVRPFCILNSDIFVSV